ncbi:MAG: 3-deoxy-manno-octulosonate cytidylyltransferase [Victivallaceae bacterium]|nr:3-deoxy-manno-octulosonate cytidylyltransferase [Victivallaceae bacterium]
MKKTVCVIPARYQSSRFPGKVLAPLLGKPMIQHVYERALESEAGEVLVAADDEKVVRAVEAFGGHAVMTGRHHNSGTDRIAEAVRNIDCDIVVNIQGDEPLLPPEVIAKLATLMVDNPEVGMATVAVPASREELEDPNKVKVVFGAGGNALYFSRSLIPFLRDGGRDVPCYLHWGIYAYRRDVLERFVRLPGGRLENCEKLEQLRALENGIAIKVLTVENLKSVGVDTPADLAEAEQYMRRMKKWK